MFCLFLNLYFFNEPLSYGTSIKTSKQDWENSSLLGFGTAWDLIYVGWDGSGWVANLIMWLNEHNTSVFQSTIAP